MRKTIILVLVLFLILTFSVIMIGFNWNKKEKITGEMTNIENNKTQEESNKSSNGTSAGDSSDEGNSAGGEVGEDSSGFDLSKTSCGAAFEEYGVCTGTCSIGKCVQEERSCYCRE